MIMKSNNYIVFKFLINKKNSLKYTKISDNTQYVE